MPYKKKWSLENIQDGFNNFKNEHGRLPTALEIDKIKNLPSSRQIQRVFGGLPNLRKTLGYTDTHFGAGKYRSEIGIDSNIRGKAGEKIIRNLLVDKFYAPFVHVESPVGESSKNRLDFYVYTSDGNFGVDVFTTSTFHDLSTNLSIKLLKYKNFQEKLYLILVSDLITSEHINLCLLRRKQPLPEKFKLLLLEDFIKEINKFNGYSHPCK